MAVAVKPAPCICWWNDKALLDEDFDEIPLHNGLACLGLGTA